MSIARLVCTLLAWAGTSTFFACPGLESTATESRDESRPRLLVLTDIGGDPDDQQSMIRLMTYANELQIEGLIASASGTPGELKEKVVKPDLIRRIVEAYGQVRDRLVQHDARYPTVQCLLDRIKSGNPSRGLSAIGAPHDTEGSRWIIQMADRSDPRPLNIAIWGGQTDLAQALWRVREERGETGLKKFLARLRVYDIADQDGIHAWIFANFPDLFYVLAKAQGGADRRLGAFRGMYLGGDETLTSQNWIKSHVLVGHGPLGALYPTKTWTAPNPHGTLKEGDTPSWFYFLANGLSDPAHPEWGCWGGRFQRGDRGLYRDAKDSVDGTTDARAAVWRWRPAFQNDFQARLDWCVKTPEEANHQPVAVVNGDASRRVLHLPSQAGSPVRLTAQGTTDPDDDRLTYRWWIYREAGTCQFDVRVDSADDASVLVQVPEQASGTNIHVVLEAVDEGTPPLTSYRRVVLEVAP